MDALGFLVLAALFAWGRWWWPAALVAVPVAALAGTTLPDLDATLGLGHRSGLTHSVLPVALALIDRRWRAVAAGLALGIGFHLSADVFPNAMRGFAIVKLPFAGSIGATESYTWLALNALASLAIGGAIVADMARPRVALLVLTITALVGVAYLFVTDGGWPALLVYGSAGWAFVRRRPG